MKRRFCILLACILLPVAAHAVTKTGRAGIPHELRVGWGDFMFESAMWHNSATTENYRYTGHIFAEYQYYFKYWFSFGVQVDYDQVWWDEIDRRFPHVVPRGAQQDCNFYNITVLPTIRFVYYSRPYVNIYLGLGAGLTINGGTETDMYGRKTALSPALNITLLGVRVGGKHAFGAVELGALNALRDKNLMYMVGARVLSVSIGVAL